jgi:hypothetical protein
MPVLRREIWRRGADLPVFVEGDLDMEWGVAVRVMDAIKGLDVPVVLVTPRSPH